jgi:hypothetical protein
MYLDLGRHSSDEILMNETIVKSSRYEKINKLPEIFSPNCCCVAHALILPNLSVISLLSTILANILVNQVNFQLIFQFILIR